jgi:hypothetical protein
MKSKSFVAGALGVLLFFTGQSLPAQESAQAAAQQAAQKAAQKAAQENTFPVPGRNTPVLPAPDQAAATLPDPDRDTSVLPVPDQAAETLPVPRAAPLPAPDRDSSTLPDPEWKVPSPSQRPAPSLAAPSPASAPARPQAAAPAPGAGDAPLAAEAGNTGPRSAASQGQSPAPVADSGARERGGPPQRGMYWGLIAGAKFPVYAIDDTDWGNSGGYDIDGQLTFNGGLFFGMDFGMLTGQAEILFTGERAKTRVLTGYSYTDMDITGLSILVPLIVKLDLRLGPVVLQPLAGFYFNFALGNLKEKGDDLEVEDPYANPLFGLMFGGDVGITLGRGIFFLDCRYAKDLGRTAAGNDPVTIWKRSALMLNLGYQFSLGRKG